MLLTLGTLGDQNLPQWWFQSLRAAINHQKLGMLKTYQPKKNINMIKHDDDYGMVYCWLYHIIEFLGIILPCGYSFGQFEPSFCPDVSTYVPYVSGGVFNILYPRHGSLNVPIEHHPTIRYMVYNGYYKVMSNIPKMGHLPTPARRTSFFWGTSFAGSMESGHPSNISESKWMNIYPLVMSK